MTSKANYVFAPKIEHMPTFTFDNVYVTENILIYAGTNMPSTRSSRNTLTLNGNLRARQNIATVTQNFSEYGPNDLYFNGNIYVAGDAVADMFDALSADLPK